MHRCVSFTIYWGYFFQKRKDFSFKKMHLRKHRRVSSMPRIGNNYARSFHFGADCSLMRRCTLPSELRFRYLPFQPPSFCFVLWFDHHLFRCHSQFLVGDFFCSVPSSIIIFFLRSECGPSGTRAKALNSRPSVSSSSVRLLEEFLCLSPHTSGQEDVDKRSE